MTQQDARAFNDVIMGTITIYSQKAHVLYNPRSTHFYASIYFSMK